MINPIKMPLTPMVMSKGRTFEVNYDDPGISFPKGVKHEKKGIKI